MRGFEFRCSGVQRFKVEKLEEQGARIGISYKVVKKDLSLCFAVAG